MVSHYDDRYEKLVQQLRKARKDSGLSQVVVAEKLGLTQPLVSRIEKGQRKIDPIELAVLCKLYRKPVKFFIPEMPV